MIHSGTMATAPAVVLDTLASLLEAEQASIVRYVKPSSPYLTRATAKLRADILEWVAASERRETELAGTIARLGGWPGPRGLQPEEQYMAYLSLRFLMPKLVDAKQLLLDRYENALTQLGKEPGTPPEVTQLLTRLRDEHAEQLAAVRKASDEVLAEK